ncbi:hypothetical protein DRN43_02355 [Thermococci archaeon]|nr:MAG: hypothetical protein DRJ03_12565 [Chloroflexota bacterium]RLF90159.1 MAG: hypothetical protein DRN43_02355 [Thermococci archaeon]
MLEVLVVGRYYTNMSSRMDNFNMPMSKIKVIKVIEVIDIIKTIKVIEVIVNILRKPLTVAILKKLLFSNKAFLDFFYNSLFDQNSNTLIVLIVLIVLILLMLFILVSK